MNAVCDLWAKGVAPRFALAQVTVPESDPARAEETLYQVMAGARAALDADGVALVGGHTTTGPELVAGFAVWGFAPSATALVRLGGLVPEDRLILTTDITAGEDRVAVIDSNGTTGRLTQFAADGEGNLTQIAVTAIPAAANGIGLVER